MPTYLELKDQAEKLMAQAEQLRQKETEDAIADIKAKIKAYGLTPQDLGFSVVGSGNGRRAPRGTAAFKAGAPAKYRGPNGESWNGGRGRKPRWVVEALAKGRKLE